MTVEIDGANNIVKTNTISEVTSANGVTVDGLNIKDSKLVTADSVVEANMSANSVDSDSYVDGSIDGVHLSSNVITGQTAETSVANDDLVLLSDTSASAGLKKMTVANLVANAGGLTLISSQKTYQTGTVTALDFQNVFTDTYDMYVIDVIGWRPTTADRNLNFRFRLSSGLISSSDYALVATSLDQDGNTATRVSAGDTQGYIFQMGSANSMSGFARCYVPRPQGMGNYKPRLFGTSTTIQNSGDDLTSDRISNKLDNTSALTGIYFFDVDGSVIYGLQVKIYGVA